MLAATNKDLSPLSWLLYVFTKQRDVQLPVAMTGLSMQPGKQSLSCEIGDVSGSRLLMVTISRNPITTSNPGRPPGSPDFGQSGW